MHLVLAPRRRLADLYGPNFPAVAAALAAALEARVAAGHQTRLYDPEEGLADLGVPPAALIPAALVTQITAIQSALAARGAIIKSLWIVGGPDAVPFATLPNPMADRDATLFSDCAYGLADTRSLLARWPVGRTPDAEPPEPGLLAALLGQVAAAHRAGPRPPGRVVALSAARWAAVTQEVLSLAGVAEEILLAPPAGPTTPDLVRLSGARLLYCNLHGVRGAATWYGQPDGDSELTPALRPQDLQRLGLAGAAVVSQACFGARLSPAGGERSLAVALLAAGAAALVAPLVLSYGAPDPPPGESDLLAARLVAALRAPGASLGSAWLEAHAATLRDLLLRRGAPDADEVKTLLTFLLYGDPALYWTA